MTNGTKRILIVAGVAYIVAKALEANAEHLKRRFGMGRDTGEPKDSFPGSKRTPESLLDLWSLMGPDYEEHEDGFSGRGAGGKW